MKLHLENGQQVSIQSEGDGCYVDDMQMNGKKYDLNYLDLNSLRQGAQISFRLSENRICREVFWSQMRHILSQNS